MTRENFPEDIEKLILEGLEYHRQEGLYLFGKLNQKEIDELTIMGIEFEIQHEINGYLLELKNYKVIK